MLRINPPAGPLRAEGKIIRAADYASIIEVEGIIAEAQRQAGEIQQLAEKERAEEKQRGFAEGTAEAKKQIDQMKLEASLKVVDYLSSAEQSVARVVVRAVEQILGEMDDKEVIFRIVRLALNSQRGEQRVEVLVHPSKTKYLEQRFNELRAVHSSIAELQIISEPSLAPDGCIIRSELGTIDASLETQLTSIRNALQPAAHEPAAAPVLAPKMV